MEGGGGEWGRNPCFEKILILVGIERPVRRKIEEKKGGGKRRRDQEIAQPSRGKEDEKTPT